MAASFLLLVSLEGIYSCTFVPQEITEWHDIIIDYDRQEISVKKPFSFADKTTKKALHCGYYALQSDDVYYPWHLFVYENQAGYMEYAYYPDKAFVMSAHQDSDIVLHDPYMNAIILRYHDSIFTTNCLYFFCNGVLYRQEKIRYGDRFDLCGVRIFYTRQGFLINRWQKITHRFYECEGADTLPQFTNSLSEKKIAEKYPEAPIYKLLPAPEQKNNSYQHQKGPVMTMSLAMLVLMLLQWYQAVTEGKSLLQWLPLVILPFSMVFSGIFWPFYYAQKESIRCRKELKVFHENQQQHFLLFQRKAKAYIDCCRQWEETRYEGKYYMVNPLAFGLGRFKKFFSFYDDCGQKVWQICEENWPLFSEGKCLWIYEDKKNALAYFDKILRDIYISQLDEKIYYAFYDPQRILPAYYFYDSHLFSEKVRNVFFQKAEWEDFYQHYQKPEKLLLICLQGEEISPREGVDLYQLHYRFCEEKIRHKPYVEIKDNQGIYCHTGTTFFHSEIAKKGCKEDYYKYALYCCKGIEEKSPESFFVFTKKGKLDLASYYQTEKNGLQADFAWKKEGVLSFNLHEDYDGPHGLIAGATGSGKSELLCSLLTNLCVYQSPEKVNLLLIDYKGGSLLQELSYQGKTIPHIVGELSDLSQWQTNRVRLALRNECRRRERLFAELHRRSGKSIANLDDYRRANPSLWKLPVKAHVLIVVDEFAQLKQENPEFLHELLQISRTGRSLGFHLLLATQKPSTCVSEEIRANSRFRIALKVFDENDSREIISTNEAYHLREPGSFYIRSDKGLQFASSYYGREKYRECYTADSDERFSRYDPVCASVLTWRTYLCREILRYPLTKRPPSFLMAPAQSYSCQQRRSLETSYNQLILGEIEDFEEEKKYPLSFAMQAGNSALFIGESKTIFSLLISYAYRQKIPMIYIGRSLQTGSGISDRILYDDEEKLQVLLARLAEGKNRKLRLLVVEDLDVLWAYSALWKEHFPRLLRLLEQQNIIPLIFTSSCLRIPYSVVQFFAQRISLRTLSKEESYVLWGEYQAGDYLCLQKDKLLSWCPAQKENVSHSYCFLPWLREIPAVILPQQDDEKILLGYNMRTQEAFYVKYTDELWILAEKESYFKKYRGYKEVFFGSLDNKNIPHTTPDRFLWIGPGLYRQHLYSYRGKADLTTKQGLWVEAGKEIFLVVLHE